MEETNPWLDPEEVKHVNKKTVKPETPYVKPDNKRKKYQRKRNEKKGDKSEESFEESKEDKDFQGGKVIYISTINKNKDEKKTSFLQTLLEELNYLPDKSKEFAINTFGEEWLNSFSKDIQDVRKDIFDSKFFPSEDKMILLKLIFLLQQA
jgi:hypothetical protein